jgi:hypothetical protein
MVEGAGEIVAAVNADRLVHRARWAMSFGAPDGLKGMTHDGRNFLYVDCDIPPGVSISTWRAQRSPARPALHRIAACLRRHSENMTTSTNSSTPASRLALT